MQVNVGYTFAYTWIKVVGTIVNGSALDERDIIQMNGSNRTLDNTVENYGNLELFNLFSPGVPHS